MMFEIKQEKARSHHDRFFWVEGDTNDVLAEVNRQLESEYVCPMYSHMALKVVEIDSSELPYRLRVKMYKNLYAGD